ncbi:MAG: LuxR C-terminal-related transcriptional regulator [Alistipes sp.]|nr:LuxR C-terminal-related transcriptional regulator [Alistipes sp.]
MKEVDRLNERLLNQNFSEEVFGWELPQHYVRIAEAYASAENAIAVLSDMRTDSSMICYGGFADTLGIKRPEGSRMLDSIWEEEVLGRIHSDDLHTKYLMELRFFHFVRHLPKAHRSRYHLVAKLRMRDATGGHIPAVHRMSYMTSPSESGIRFALCLYNPLSCDIADGGFIVDSVTGRIIGFDRHDDARILSEREKEVLRLIDKGLTSKHIAHMLSISVNTVSRHRQEILRKLHVRNSIEACRVSRELGII